jgi:cation-transporting ATPase E
MASGADVTKNISDVILLDDDISKLAEVIQEGKEILFNTLRSAQLLLIKNYYSVALITISLLLGLTFPFNPRGLFVVVFFNSQLPVLTMLVESGRTINSHSFMRELKQFVFIGGTIAAALGLFVLLYFEGQYSRLTVQTLIMSFFIFTGFANAVIVLNYSYKFRDMLFGSWRNLIGVLNLILFAGFMTFSPLRDYFGFTAYPDLLSVVIIILLALVYAVTFSITARIVKSRYSGLFSD